MYTSYKVAELIKSRAKEQNVQLKIMFQELKLNKNTLSNMYNGSMIKGDSLGKIADYLDCSVDYLLSRVATPNSTYTINNKNTTVNGTQANVINHNAVSESVTDTLTEQFIQKFEELDFSHKIKVINIVNDMVENNW